MKTAKVFISIIIFLTLFLNLINLYSAVNYENEYAKYNRDLINSAENNIAGLQQACAQIKEPIEGYAFYNNIALWSLYSIIILFLIFLLIFLLVKSKKVSLSDKDWKWFRNSVFIAFIALIIFLFAFWLASDNSYLARCLHI
jgi:ABC-type Fe3+ transport system permease subunit